MQSRSGFALIELILTLCIATIFFPLESKALSYFMNQDYSADTLQDEISLAQLRRVLNLCYEKKLVDNTLVCSYKQNAIEFRYKNKRLYTTTGTWIFLNEVDDLFWNIQDHLVFLNYRRDNCWREAVLAYE